VELYVKAWVPLGYAGRVRRVWNQPSKGATSRRYCQAVRY